MPAGRILFPVVILLCLFSGAGGEAGQSDDDCFPKRTVPVDRWTGEYFNNLTLFGNPAMLRDEGQSALNFDWGAGSPGAACGVNADQFSARFTRTVTLPGGVFTFTIAADDGIRVKVDGATILDRWIDQAATYRVDLPLEAGNHKIAVEYYERWGNANLSVSWVANPCFVATPPEHWRGEYFDNPSLSGSPRMVRDDDDRGLDFDWQTRSPESACQMPADDFSVRWSRKLIAEAGRYRFTITADDGVRFYVNGRKLLDEWRHQRPTTFTTEAVLPEGRHDLRLEYYEHTGEAVIRIDWRKVGIR